MGVTDATRIDSLLEHRAACADKLGLGLWRVIELTAWWKFPRDVDDRDRLVAVMRDTPSPKLGTLSYPEITQALGGRSHTTIMESAKRGRALLAATAGSSGSSGGDGGAAC